MLDAVANCALALCVGFAIEFKHLLAPVFCLSRIILKIFTLFYSKSLKV